MDEKINLKAVDVYSEQYAAQLITTSFVNKEKISGPEILQFSEVKQVNLFIIRGLMHAWKLESQKLRSPYFDFQSDEVTKALTNYQNVLSNHILISRHDFHPLVKRAVAQTLYVVLDPYDFYSDSLDTEGKSYISVADLKNDIKYLKVNRQPLERLVQKLEEKKLSTVAGTEAFGLLDSILEEVNFTPEEIDPFIQQFSKTLPLDLTKLYEQRLSAPKAPAEKPAPPREKPVEAPSSSSAPRNNFHKINQIKDSLTINQKFMFTKILFNGDFEIFSHAIDRLDNFENLEAALEFLESNYGDWDRDSEEYLEFREMLEKRFA